MQTIADVAPVMARLLAEVPDHRLRPLVLELLLSGVPTGAPARRAHCASRVAVSPVDELDEAAPKVRSPKVRAPAKKRTRPPWSKERRAAFEAAKAANGAAASTDPATERRRKHSRDWARRKRASERAKTEQQAEVASNDRNGEVHESVSPQAFWAKARQLSPKEPWQAAAQELDGVTIGGARQALRNATLPTGVDADDLTRFLALPVVGSATRLRALAEGAPAG